MKHTAVRIDDLMYKGCEPHWMCTRCKMAVPFHCCNKQQFEEFECREKDIEEANKKTTNRPTGQKGQ